jgi:hypothetical protein
VSKYHSTKTVVDGITFDSKAEAKRYGELLLLQKAGEIRELELQPEYVLVYPFVYQGKKYCGVKYRADFRYRIIRGIQGIIVEDVKGHRTALYQVKKQMLLSKYPDINFVEVENR